MSGFIDPNASQDRRIERLELLMAEVLKEWDVVVLSPEAQAELNDLMSGDEGRRHRALRRSHERLAADPLPGHIHDDECEWNLCPHRTTSPDEGGARE